jgi:hypothetical protein
MGASGARKIWRSTRTTLAGAVSVLTNQHLGSVGGLQGVSLKKKSLELQEP